MSSPSTIAHEPGVKKPDPILVVAGVRRTFGGLLAVDVDHLEVQRNTITALIGPNGAGKTTLFNLLTGFDNAGRRHAGSSTASTSRAGARIASPAPAWSAPSSSRRRCRGSPCSTTCSSPRRTSAASTSSPRSGAAGAARSVRTSNARSTCSTRYQLHDKRNDHAGTLSGGQRKLLEMARALMVDPKLVMLDEPMAGVNPALVQSLLEHIRELRDEGRTVVFVEHDMDVVMNISDWVVCMAQGQVIAEAPPAAIVTDESVIDAYLGTHHGERPGPTRGGAS